MKIDVDGLSVSFPYNIVYDEQFEYMVAVKRSVDNQAHCMLEMPSGTGKTICLWAVLMAYLRHQPFKVKKIIYCSRTVTELENAVNELRHLVGEIEKENGEKPKILGISLSSRRNMCINDTVLKDRSNNIDAVCRSMTASFVREYRQRNECSVPMCDFFENFYDLKERGEAAILPYGIYQLEDLREFGKERAVCPYFLTRHSVVIADIVVYSYYYLLDPKIANLISKELPKTSVVIFDEAHNIDNVCIDSLSCTISLNTVKSAKIALRNLKQVVQKKKEVDEAKLKKEYDRLVSSLRLAEKGVSDMRTEDAILAIPVPAEDALIEPIPGNIRQNNHFLNFIERLVSYMDMKLRTQVATFETPASFLKDCFQRAGISRHPLRFCSERIQLILFNLEIPDVTDYLCLFQMANFATLVATYIDGFSIIIEPFDERTPTIPNPVLHFNCLNSAIAITPVFRRFNTVIITSGTLSPLEMYRRILDFKPAICLSLKASFARNCILPLIVTKGSDQKLLTTKFESREDTSITRNYGHLLLELSKVVPDGIVGFFPSYTYLESTFSEWYISGIVEKIQKQKMIFIETQNADETNMALVYYKKACENGRGGILLSVARGKVSEGIDFAHHFGRCVILFGIPFFFNQSRVIKARMNYLRDHFRILENDFINFDAMRHAAQCLGRVIRGKTDYGLMILADKRYNRYDKRGKLPQWISRFLDDTMLNLSTEEAVNKARRFYREMGQEFDFEEQQKLATICKGK